MRALPLPEVEVHATSKPPSASARTQAAPQRLLLVFAGAELPDDATAEQRTAFEAGQGGALVPLMCVDKRPEELDSFAQLCAEADGQHSGWRVVLAEQDDLASHTSSSSTKLIHGGLRYLEHGEFGLVRKALMERERLLRSALDVMQARGIGQLSLSEVASMT